MQNITLITAIAGLVFGFVGMVLGVINTWRNMSHDRIRLHVSPRWSIFSSGEHALCIEVVNHSHVAVTVAQVGYKLWDKEKIFLILPIQPGDTVPKRLEPRTSLTAIARPGTEHNPAMRAVVSAFAKTECGRVFTGTSPALRAIVDAARSSAAKNPDHEDAA